MNKEKLKIVGIIVLVLSMVAGIYVGNVYFNIPMECPYIFSLASVILVGIGRVFSKGDKKQLPEPLKENVLRSKVAGSAGLSGLAVILGIVVGFNVISYFEKAGNQPSIFWLFAVLIGVPAAGIIFFLKKRASIIRTMKSEKG